MGEIAPAAPAAGIAARYRTESSVRRLCQTVVPVAGLLAQLGGTLTETEFRAVARLGQLAEEDAGALLLSADRFETAPSPLGLATEERRHLLERFGIYGLRLANALVRAGQGSSARALAEELRRRSGLDELRRELATQFAGRRDLLKARSTLAALGELTRRVPGPGTATLAADVERVVAGAHELAELRLLTAVRAGALRLDEDEEVEIERLVGPRASVADRLGLPVDATADQVRAAALAAHGRWATRAESPLSSVAVADAARVVQRSYEGMLVIA